MKLLIITLAAVLSIAVSAQELDGTFVEGTDTISFNGNNIKFKLKGNDGLGMVFVGEGTYEIMDDFILIKTEKYGGVNTKVELKSAEKKDTTQIQFFDPNGFSIKGIRAEFLNKSGKTVSISMSDDHGMVYFKKDPKVSAVKASDLLYDKIVFDLKDSTDFTVFLVNKRVLEDKSVVMKLFDQQDNQFKVKLLSTDFRRKRPSVSHFNSLDKKSKNTIDRPRVFQKPLY